MSVVVVLTKAVDVVDETKVGGSVVKVVEEVLEVERSVTVKKAVPTLVETTVLGIAVLTVLTIVEVKEHDGIMAESNWL
jgi:hypothetical protein